ncbi:MAG: Spy/CpxP family protein refolding chaperone [Enhydrobacter sp.]
MNRPVISHIVRSLAVATLAGTTLFTGALAPASAQDNKAPAAAAATSSKPETVEERITTLKTALKITPAQETHWTGVATAMRENATAMETLVKSKRAKTGDMTAMDDLLTYQEFSQARLDGLKNLTSSFRTLYEAMPADQKKIADGVFQSYGPAKS